MGLTSLFYPWGIILQAVAILHFVRRRPDTYWLWIILIGGGLGAFVYIVAEVVPDVGLLRGSLDVFPRRRRIRDLERIIIAANNPFFCFVQPHARKGRRFGVRTRLMLLQFPLLYLSVGVVKLRDSPRSDTLIAMHPWWLIAGGVLLVAIMVGLFRPRRPQGHDLGVISSQWIAQHRSSTHDPDR